MTDEDKEIGQLKIDVAELRQRISFLERTVYWFIGFVALNLIGSFLLWVSTLKKQ